MPLNSETLYKVFNPAKTINYADPEQRKYYIDFSEVRSAGINELNRSIELSAPENTCQLFTGHIGCGKSTELLRLKTKLESQGYHVVYCLSSEESVISDIDITDILLLIAREISMSLSDINIKIRPDYFSKLFSEIKEFLFTDIEFEKLDFALGLAKISTKIKTNPGNKAKLREYLEPRTDSIIDSINNDVVIPAIKNLKDKGNKGLVVIVDNLDRIDNKMKTPDQTQPEYIFFNRGEQLRSLKCNLIYTFPLILRFSNDATPMFTSRFGIRPKILPMIPVRLKDGSAYEKGIELLKQMVFARAFPETVPEKRDERTGELFEKPEILEKLCKISGGHIRNLIGFLHSCIETDDPPVSEDVFDSVIQEYRDELVKKITADEWELIKQVVKEQSVAGEEQSDRLLRSMFVFEYQLNKHGSWFDINPLLEGHSKLA